jgi:hypothetical protein
MVDPRRHGEAPTHDWVGFITWHCIMRPTWWPCCGHAAVDEPSAPES